ncbi:class II fructose-bisphosphate aldolase [Enterococcus sp. LJL99]
MLVNSKQILSEAKKKKYAVPAPNFIDLDSARCYVQLAERRKLPLILPFAQAHEELLPLEEAALIGKYLAKKATVPVALHLDHGQDVAFIHRAIELGFTSVMIDASTESFERNIQLSKEIAKYAHQFDVTVEAELGHVGAGENYESQSMTDSIYTEVADVVTFVEQTNIDSLAVSIGTAHGTYKGTPKLNFERLNEISEKVTIPLVLHGGSSSGDKNLAYCATHGISKINIFTDLINGAYNSIKESEPKNYLDLKKEAALGMEKILDHYYQLFQTK